MHIAIGNRIGRKNQFSWTRYWTNKSNFWVKKNTRSGLTLPDAISGNDIQIVPGVGLIDASNYAIRTVANIGNTASGYVEVKFNYVTSNSALYLFSSCDEGTGTSYAYVYMTAASKAGIAFRFGGTFTNVYTTNAAISTGWHTIRFESTGSEYIITVDGVVAAGTAVVGANNGKWFNTVTNRDNAAIGLLKQNVETKSSNTHYISYVDLNGISKWYLTGAGKYIYDVIGGMHLTITGTGHQSYDPEGSVQLLSVGYTLYTKVTEPDEYVPYVSAGVPYDASALLTGYTAKARSSNDLHNLAPSLIDFDPTETTPTGVANYDLSNATQWNALARAWTGYDAAHPYRIPLLTVFDPVVYYDWRNVNYEYMIFCGGDRVGVVPSSLSELLSFATNQTASEVVKILNYLGR